MRFPHHALLRINGKPTLTARLANANKSGDEFSSMMGETGGETTVPVGAGVGDVGGRTRHEQHSGVTIPGSVPTICVDDDCGGTDFDIADIRKRLSNPRGMNGPANRPVWKS